MRIIILSPIFHDFSADFSWDSEKRTYFPRNAGKESLMETLVSTTQNTLQGEWHNFT
jgi:hypothetical protein